MNWESMLRLMKNPLFREFADLVIQNRDLVADTARKWGTRKPRPEGDREPEPGFAPVPATPSDDGMREHLDALETALAETRAAAEQTRMWLDEVRSKLAATEGRVAAQATSSEAVAQRIEALENRIASLDNTVRQAISRIAILETEAVGRARRFVVGVTALTLWSVLAAVLIHLLLR